MLTKVFFRLRFLNQKLLFNTLFFVLIALMKTTFSYGEEAQEINGQSDQEKPIVVLITSYNNAQWVHNNLKSVFDQKYSNYRVIYVDDCSSDGTTNFVEQFVKENEQEHRFTLIRNEERKLALSNIFYAVYSCDDDEIIVSLDGDDWFYTDVALSRVNRAYSSNQVWLTHGKMIEHPTNWTHWSIPVPQDIISRNAFREYRCPTHLRTFYVWLFKKIKQEDLMYEGKFFAMTWDQAMMFPMIEMAGERHEHIYDLLYVYNTATSISDNKVNPHLQNVLEAYIRAMPRYKRLDDSEVPYIYSNQFKN